ncbi:hypothetical protein KIPB_000852, partial [Kipferlia bialata]
DPTLLVLFPSDNGVIDADTGTTKSSGYYIAGVQDLFDPTIGNTDLNNAFSAGLNEFLSDDTEDGYVAMMNTLYGLEVDVPLYKTISGYWPSLLDTPTQGTLRMALARHTVRIERKAIAYIQERFRAQYLVADFSFALAKFATTTLTLSLSLSLYTLIVSFALAEFATTQEMLSLCVFFSPSAVSSIPLCPDAGCTDTEELLELINMPTFTMCYYDASEIPAVNFMLDAFGNEDLSSEYCVKTLCDSIEDAFTRTKNNECDFVLADTVLLSAYNTACLAENDASACLTYPTTDREYYTIPISESSAPAFRLDTGTTESTIDFFSLSFKTTTVYFSLSLVTLVFGLTIAVVAAYYIYAFCYKKNQSSILYRIRFR